MSSFTKNTNNSIFNKIIEAIGWLQIALSPILNSIGIAVGWYYFFQNGVGKIMAFAIVLIGFVVGIIWATHIKRKRGTIAFLSRGTSTESIPTDEEKTIT